MDKLDIYYNNRLVGNLAYRDGIYYFQYSQEWLSNGFSISPFSMPLENRIYRAKNNIFGGIQGVFADSLPDSWGQLLFERFIANHKEMNVENMLDRLSLIGTNGMGALEFKPSASILIDNENIDYDKFQDEANKLLSSLMVEDIEELYKRGGSSGGARPKALIELGGEAYIVKFQSKYDIDNSGVVEYEYAKCAMDCGINIPECRLIEDKYFAIKRFDRKPSGKVHMISAASLLEVDYNSPCLDYNDLFKMVKIITFNDETDVLELFKRMCFNVYAHNLDDHAKNFSFIYDDDIRRYKLSPAYDMTYSNTYFKEHTTSVNGKGKNITDKDLLDVGKNAKLKIETMTQIMKDIKDKISKQLIKYINM